MVKSIGFAAAAAATAAGSGGNAFTALGIFGLSAVCHSIGTRPTILQMGSARTSLTSHVFVPRFTIVAIYHTFVFDAILPQTAFEII